MNILQKNDIKISATVEKLSAFVWLDVEIIFRSSQRSDNFNITWDFHVKSLEPSVYLILNLKNIFIRSDRAGAVSEEEGDQTTV